MTHVRHSDPDTPNRDDRLRRDTVLAENDLWLSAGSGSEYDLHRRRAQAIARETGLPLPLAIRDETDRMRLGWDRPHGVGAKCEIRDRWRYDDLKRYA